ncbi:MAG: efflux RND transporter periplasmic adaptor subunit [Ignavibacteriales bacterium]|nr:efflux RND transporter periplasmic adaptor subunit [Ignavibacteriales bacterium]
MHPQVRMDGPGACPICGMDLIKKTEDIKEPAAGNDSDMVNMVTLTGKKQVLANVSTVMVSREKLNREISVYSYLDFTEQSRKIISARFNGRIEKLYVNQTGQYVKIGQPLFEIYSPDLVQAQNDFLIALNGLQQIDNSSLVAAAKIKLELFGMTTSQIKQIEETRKIQNILTYYSPISGTVIEKRYKKVCM